LQRDFYFRAYSEDLLTIVGTPAASATNGSLGVHIMELVPRGVMSTDGA
jgi:hypothetical protein